MPVEALDADMATVHFRDETEPIETDRVFVAENGWVAVTEGERAPTMFPPHRIDRVEGTDDIYYDTAVLAAELGSRTLDDDGHVVQEPEIVRRMVTEIEIY